MIVLGLTGSIGMGKTATAAMFREAGVPVYDADAEVHRLYAPGGAAVAPVEAAFPGVSEDGAINRKRLSERVLSNPEALKQLESIVHPLAAARQTHFRERAQAIGAPFVVLDIPLLFETAGDEGCDYVAVVTAPAEMQRARALSRPEMTEARFEAILVKQLPDADKRARADFVISTAFGFDFTRRHVGAIIDLLTNQLGPRDI